MKPGQGEECQEIGAEYAEPEEDHGAAQARRHVIEPEDKPNMDELCRREGEAQFAPAARQKRRKDHRAVARKASSVPRSPAPKMTSRIIAKTNAMMNASPIHDGALTGHQGAPRSPKPRGSSA